MAIFSSLDFVYLILSFVTIYVIHFYFNYFRRPDKLPGPLPLPIIGNVHQYSNNLSVWGKWLQSNYGEIGEVWFGSERAIWIGGPQYLDKVLKPSPGNYNSRAIPRDALNVLDMSYKGIGLNRDYNSWHNNRKYFTKAISSPLFLRMSVKFTHSLFSEMADYWDDLNRQNIEIDLANWMLRFFAEAIFLITTSKKSNAIKNHYEVLCHPEKNSADTEFLVNHVRSIFSSFEFFLTTPDFMYFLPSYDRHAKKLLESFDWMRKYYLPDIIKRRRDEIKRTPIDQELVPDMLTMMLTFNTERDTSQNVSIDESSEPMSDENVCENLFEMVVGGIDTSTNTVCFIIYYLCQYPEVKQRLVEEIRQHFGSNSNFDIKYEDLSKLHYCEAVIKEVTRFKTLAPFVFRMAENPDEIDGHKFKGSTQVFINAQEIHMNESYWENPKKFDPERFLPSANNEIKKNSYLAFGGGMRICPGRNLAMAEIKTLIVLIFSRYDVELVDPFAPLKTKCTIANHCEELKVRLVSINS